MWLQTDTSLVYVPPSQIINPRPRPPLGQKGNVSSFRQMMDEGKVLTRAWDDYMARPDGYWGA